MAVAGSESRLAIRLVGCSTRAARLYLSGGQSYAAATKAGITGLLPKAMLPGQYFLIQEADDSNDGAPLPSPDFVNFSNPQNPHHIGSVSHKVALFRTTTRFTGGSNPAGSPNFVDLVGYGNSNAYEGSGPVPALIRRMQCENGLASRHNRPILTLSSFTPRIAFHHSARGSATNC